MQTAVRLVIDSTLDDETIAEIEMMRKLRLNHYQNVARIPEKSLEILKKAGLTEETTPEQLQAKALETIAELEERIKQPAVIYEDELSMYVQTLSVSDADF
jgi:hypothetical protein